MRGPGGEAVAALFFPPGGERECSYVLPNGSGRRASS